MNIIRNIMGEHYLENQKILQKENHHIIKERVAIEGIDLFLQNIHHLSK